MLLFSAWGAAVGLPPLIFGLALTVLRKGNIVKANNSGEREHPCLVPLVIPNRLESRSVTFTSAVR